MLSTTFSTIVSNATAEIQFRRAVLTLEGVKSDAIFAYQPPFNILALLILLPLKQVLTPRWFHKINVAAVRVLNAPLLLIIGFIERRTLWSGTRRQKEIELPKPAHARVSLWDFSRGFSVYGDIQAVFDAEPPQEVEDEIEADDDLSAHFFEREFAQEFGKAAGGAEVKDKDGDGKTPRPGLNRTMTNKSMKSRRDSVMPFVGMSQRMRDLLNEGSEDEEGEGLKGRLEALEKSTGRIEEMLGRLCEELDDGPRKWSEGSIEGRGETGTLNDLDRSGTADIDD